MPRALIHHVMASRSGVFQSIDDLIREGLRKVFCCCFWKHVDICQSDFGDLEGLEGWKG